MRVVMQVQISGSRDGERWPAPGDVIDVPDAEAAELIAQGYAEVAPEPKPAPKAPVEKAVRSPRGERRTSKD